MGIAFLLRFILLTAGTLAAFSMFQWADQMSIFAWMAEPWAWSLKLGAPLPLAAMVFITLSAIVLHMDAERESNVALPIMGVLLVCYGIFAAYTTSSILTGFGLMVVTVSIGTSINGVAQWIANAIQAWAAKTPLHAYGTPAG